MRINNVVLELKHPQITLGQKELQQVRDYLQTVKDIPQFNASNMSWEFYLLGRDYDSYIEDEFENAKSHGERHLVYKVGNYKIFVLKWSEVFTNVELSHRFLVDKLQLRRNHLLTDKESADGIVLTAANNLASSTHAIESMPLIPQ